jgi:hypothetical protein
VQLKELAPALPFVRVLQGWTLDDYRRCVGMYEAALMGSMPTLMALAAPTRFAHRAQPRRASACAEFGSVRHRRAGQGLGKPGMASIASAPRVSTGRGSRR